MQPETNAAGLDQDTVLVPFSVRAGKWASARSPAGWDLNPKRFAKTLIHWFVEKRSQPIDVVGASKTTWVPSKPRSASEIRISGYPDFWKP